jgi:Ca2+:H+ antiporter
VLPAFTTSTPGGTYSTRQLWFVAVTSFALWAIFVFIQTVRHRDYFIPLVDAANLEVHAEPPTIRETWASFGLLLVVSLVVVVGLAKLLSPTIEHAVELAGAPRGVGGIVIAMLVLLPETWAAVRAARAECRGRPPRDLCGVPVPGACPLILEPPANTGRCGPRIRRARST